jgi:hypothetical protein
MNTNQLALEYNESIIKNDGIFSKGKSTIMITPSISPDYWIFRVKLGEGQAMLGFPKFSTIGIGFALEEDWNTNLPYTCDADQIYGHIEHNKQYDSITKEDCIKAIQLIQEAAKEYKSVTA